LYQKEVRFLHKPIDFFKELNLSADEIIENHKKIKLSRSELWANENKSSPGKYNLFMDNSKQVLGYAIYRWGVPLAVPYLLEKDFEKEKKSSNQPLVDYLENHSSSELMSQDIKDNNRYGLGKAIGDKAAHLFTKWYIHTFKLSTKKSNEWGNLSYELPLDSNAGRVLFRSGFLLSIANLENYKIWKVIQENAGKNGKNYIRVTNIRGNKINSINIPLVNSYKEITTKYLKTRKREPKYIEIQQLPNAFLKDNVFGYGIGHLDDGLIYIGTNFCFNHDSPKCNECPIKEYCEGYNEKKELISEYRT